MKHFGLSGKDASEELRLLDTAELGSPREGQTIKTGNILKEGRGSSIFSKGLQLSRRFFTLYVEDGRPTLKYLNSETSQVLGVCDLTNCKISKSKNPRKDAVGASLCCMRLDMSESPVNTNRDKLKLTLCFQDTADMNSWYTALNWAIDFKINVQQRDMDRAKKQVQARDQSHAQRRGSVQPGLLPATKEPSWAKRKSAPDVLKTLSPEQLESLSLNAMASPREDAVDSRPTAKFFDGPLTQIGAMSLTGDQRFLVLNGNRTESTLFVYESVTQEKLIVKVDLRKLEKLEIANKMVGTSLIVKESGRSAITFYAHEWQELTVWGVAIALNYLACLPADAAPAPGISDSLCQKALASTKQSEKQIDELLEQVYATIGHFHSYDTEQDEIIRVLQHLLMQLRGHDMLSGAQRNESPGIASMLVKNGVGKAKDSFGMIIIAVDQNLVQGMLENWQELKPRIVMDLLGWIIDFEELLSDFSIYIDESTKFSSRPEYGAALKATCPRFLSNFRFFTADMNGEVEEGEFSTETKIWMELRAQRILVYSRAPEPGMQVTPIAVYPISRMRSFKRISAPVALANQKRDRTDSSLASPHAVAAGAAIHTAAFPGIQALPMCSHETARRENRQCSCCVAFFHVDDCDVMSCFVCMSSSEQAALQWVNALQLAQRALQARLTGPVANEIPEFKQLYDNDRKSVENAVHDKCLQEFTRVPDRQLSSMLEACDRLLQYMKVEVRKIQRWDLDDDECSRVVATMFANIIVETVTNFLLNSAKSNDVDFIEHDEAFYLCRWSLSFQGVLEEVGVFSTDIISYDVCMYSHSLELLHNYAESMSKKLVSLLKACALQDFAPDFQLEKRNSKTEAGLLITTTPIDVFSFLNGMIYSAVATGHQLAIAFVAFACIPVLKVFVQDWKVALLQYLQSSPSFELLLIVANSMRHCCNLLVTLERDAAISSLSAPECVAFIASAASILGKTFPNVEDLLSDVRPHFQDAWKSCVAPLVDCICSNIRSCLDPERVPDKSWNNGTWCCVTQLTHIVDEDTGRSVRPFPQPDSSSEVVTIVATLQSYYEDLERDLDRRILMVVNPLLLMRVVQLYIAKVLIPGVIDSEGLFEYRMKKDFEALLEFFTDSDSHPRRTADGSKHISADTQEMISNIRVQVKFFEEMFFESCKIENVMQEEADEDFDDTTETSLFCDQFEQLLLETDITVGVARRVLEKRHDLKNRAFNDLKKSAEKKCIELVEDIMQRRHLKSQPLVNASALKLFSLASCDDVAIPWLQQNKTKLKTTLEEPPKEEKVFAKRGSILGSLTASISEALSSSTASHSDTLSSSADANDGIFMTLKRKGSLLSGAIFQSSEGSGRRPSDAPAAAASLDSSSTASGSKYELVLAILEDIGSKDLLPRFKENDYSDDVIVDMTPKDVDEMVATLQMNAGQKIKFRRELKKRGLCQG